MGTSRKLQGEIDRVLKRAQESVHVFDSIWNKVYDHTDNMQREKFEAGLKKEIRKLQRYRDQIKTWIQSSEIKDKKALMHYILLIERGPGQQPKTGVSTTSAVLSMKASLAPTPAQIQVAPANVQVDESSFQDNTNSDSVPRSPLPKSSDPISSVPHTSSANHDVPGILGDVLVEILSRLPVKSLLRFKSVCKHWRTIISSPFFIATHFHQKSNSTGLLVYREGKGLGYGPDLGYRKALDINPYDCLGCPDFYAFTLFPDKTLQVREVANHREVIGPIREMHGPCNGVFGLVRLDRKLVLWNPSTKRSRLVSPPPREVPNFRGFDDFGFGMDPSTDDLKIVLFDPFLKQADFLIYTLSTDTWKSF